MRAMKGSPSRAAQLLALLLTAFVLPTAADDRAIEEIVVTARQQAEGLQDVPVTVAVMTREDLDRYNVRNLEEAARLVPNFQINRGGSGNGSNLFLRGVGSSSISAAFDQSVALNIDGVVVNRGRFIHNAQLDMGQLEVLKGPQSLYFGKSATAGVVSITSNDPGTEFEIDLQYGYETEHDQNYGTLIVSGPLTNSLGARLALGASRTDEQYRNLNPNADHRWRGEETLDARITLLFEPSETFRARLKHSYSRFENDGPIGNTEEFCPEGAVQPTVALGQAVALPGIDDCRLNGNTSASDLLSPLAVGNPIANGGVPFLDQETHLTAFQIDWDLNEHFALTSVTGYIDLDHTDFDIYDYNAGIFGGGHTNTYQSLSQEFRLASNFEGRFNFLAGAFYQDIEQEFLAHQYAANIALTGLTIPGLTRNGLDVTDPANPRGYDYNKNHFLDTEVLSLFIAGYVDLTEDLELTAGIRYTDEDKAGRIEIPYVHVLLQGTFGAPPVIDGLDFDDQNWSPEVALNYHLTSNISVFSSYKQGFKSGGVDNSALPTASLDPNTNPNFPGFLLYDSEEASGFEFGMKGDLQDGALRLNASAFRYVYDDLQTQLFDSEAIQFTTLNASELTVTGLEADLLYLTEIDGLTLRGSLAFTNAEYTDDFFNTDNENLDGQDRERNADLTANAGFTWERLLGSTGWHGALSFDLRYNSGYNLMATLNPYEQDSFVLADAALRLYSQDERYEVSIIGRNLGDEIIAFSSGNRPGACVNAQLGNPPGSRCDAGVLNIQQDQVVTTGLGRQIQLQFRVRL